MSKSRVSVIVPIYNVSEYLDRCINSIRNQSYRNLDIILVDDGSMDGSGTIADGYSEIDERIQVIHKENGGLVSARKAGLASAAGEYIGFVDGDDYIENDMYEELLTQAISDDADIVHERMVVDDKLYPSIPSGTYELLADDKYDFFNQFVFGTNAHIHWGIVTKLFRAEIIKNNYLKVPDNCSYGEDAICFIRCLLEADRLSVTDYMGYHYILRDSSVSHKEESVIKKAVLYNELYSVLRTKEDYNRISKSFERYMARNLLSCIRDTNPERDFINTYMINNPKRFDGKRVVLYGAGRVGRDYYLQLCRYPNIDIVAWLDSAYREKIIEYYELEAPERICDYSYDIIIVAIKDQAVSKEIVERLKKLGVEGGKIIWEPPEMTV